MIYNHSNGEAKLLCPECLKKHFLKTTISTFVANEHKCNECGVRLATWFGYVAKMPQRVSKP